MRGVRILCACFGLLALAVSLVSGLRAQEKQAKGEFFNGKDLTGWEGRTDAWKVVDGAIVGTTPEGGLKANTFLCSKAKYGDFEMSFKVRLKGGVGNSGIQIRSKVFDAKEFRVSGPQADICQQYWGSLYGEGFSGMMKASPADKVKTAVKTDGFTDFSVRCVGQKVTIKVGGEVMVDQDFDKAWAEKEKKQELPAEGIIALQLHTGPNMEVTFKDIKFSEIKK